MFISSPGGSLGRAIVLPPALAAASALAKSLTLKFLCDGQGAVRRAILSLWQVLFHNEIRGSIPSTLTLVCKIIVYSCSFLVKGFHYHRH